MLFRRLGKRRISLYEELYGPEYEYHRLAFILTGINLLFKITGIIVALKINTIKKRVVDY